MGTGVVLGAALATLAAYLGDVRGTVPVLLALILGGGVAGAFPLTRRLLKAGSAALALLLALCLLTPVLRGLLASLTLDSSSRARFVRGLELWRAGYAPVLTVSEQSGLLGPANCVKLSELKRAHIAALYPVGGPQVLTLRRVTTTRDEAARVRDLARERAWRRVLLVTSPSHSRRAARLFTAQGANVVSVPADRLAALRTQLYEGLSRVKAAVGGTPER